MAAMLSESQLLSSISLEKARMGVGLKSEANLESILKADSSLRMLAALSTKWLPPREACCMAELYLPSAAADNHISTCQHVVHCKHGTDSTGLSARQYSHSCYHAVFSAQRDHADRLRSPGDQG